LEFIGNVAVPHRGGNRVIILACVRILVHKVDLWIVTFLVPENKQST